MVSRYNRAARAAPLPIETLIGHAALRFWLSAGAVPCYSPPPFWWFFMSRLALHTRFSSLANFVLVAVIFCAASGCVQRRFTVRSNPPGALVYIDDYEIGTTPCSTDFTYYGTRKIRLVKDGYETLTVLQPVPTPWYQYPGIDFVSENLVPGEIRDERVLDFQLQPQVIVPTDILLGRAEELRRTTGQAPAISQPPPSFSPPPGITAPPETLPPPAFGPN